MAPKPAPPLAKKATPPLPSAKQATRPLSPITDAPKGVFVTDVPLSPISEVPLSPITDAFGIHIDLQGRHNLFICRQNPAAPTLVVRIKLPCKAPAGFAPTSPFKIVEGIAQQQNALNIVIDLTSSESFDEWQILDSSCGRENLTFVQFQEFGAQVINSFMCGSPQDERIHLLNTM